MDSEINPYKNNGIESPEHPFSLILILQILLFEHPGIKGIHLLIILNSFGRPETGSTHFERGSVDAVTALNFYLVHWHVSSSHQPGSFQARLEDLLPDLSAPSEDMFTECEDDRQGQEGQDKVHDNFLEDHDVVVVHRQLQVDAKHNIGPHNYQGQNDQPEIGEGGLERPGLEQVDQKGGLDDT